MTTVSKYTYLLSVVISDSSKYTYLLSDRLWWLPEKLAQLDYLDHECCTKIMSSFPQQDWPKNNSRIVKYDKCRKF